MTVVKRCTTCHHGPKLNSDYPCNQCIAFKNWTEPMSSIPPMTQSVNDPEDSVTWLGSGEVKGVKYDKDKPKWSLLPFKALAEVVDVLTYGARKYAPDNWKKVPDARTRYVDAAFRHFTAYINGEKNDSETGLNHLAHAICCLLFLLAFDKGEHHGESNNDD